MTRENVAACTCIDPGKPCPVPGHDDARKTYRVVRRYQKSGRRKIILRGVSLEVARLHCNDPRTRKAGVWFDGYEEE